MNKAFLSYGGGTTLTYIEAGCRSLLKFSSMIRLKMALCHMTLASTLASTISGELLCQLYSVLQR